MAILFAVFKPVGNIIADGWLHKRAREKSDEAQDMGISAVWNDYSGLRDYRGAARHFLREFKNRRAAKLQSAYERLPASRGVRIENVLRSRQDIVVGRLLRRVDSASAANRVMLVGN